MASLADLERVLGPEGTRRLLAARGGQMVYIPQHPKEGHWLREALGPEMAFHLCQAFGGEQHDLPTGASYIAEDRHQEVVDLLDQGLSLNQVAARLGISRSAVVKLAKKLPALPGQLELF